MLGVLVLSACSSQGFLNATTPDSGYGLSQNVVFDDSTGLKLDIYSPQNAGNAPVVVFFFGARWEEGDKEEYKFVGQALAARGFVTVIPNYRFYPQVHYREILLDCAKAVVWTHSHIGSYGGSPGRIVVMGHSAGAYNASMLALDPEFMKQAGGNRLWIRGLIGLAGPYNFLPITDPDLRDLFGPPESFESSQPVFHVDGGAPPILLMHGGKDETVDVQNTNELYDRIKRANGSVEKVLYPDLDHKWIIADVATRLQGQADVADKIDDFVKRVTVGNPPQAQQPSSIQTFVPK
ncbi:MAG: alpha/beta hydrolase [Nevskia sp.]|nr:alpha/beta hydrolase [Nevskia sp.]